MACLSFSRNDVELGVSNHHPQQFVVAYDCGQLVEDIVPGDAPDHWSFFCKNAISFLSRAFSASRVTGCPPLPPAGSVS